MNTLEKLGFKLGDSTEVKEFWVRYTMTKNTYLELTPDYVRKVLQDDGFMGEVSLTSQELVAVADRLSELGWVS